MGSTPQKKQILWKESLPKCHAKKKPSNESIVGPMTQHRSSLLVVTWNPHQPLLHTYKFSNQEFVIN